jgi:cation transport ATPase
MKMAMLVLVSSLAFVAHADEKTCAVKGMHCEACAEMVQGKVCEEGKYSTCDVKVGQIHLITKDATAKIDESAVGAAVKESGYSLQKCKLGKAKGDDSKAAKAKG